jgi:hypothetical protein
MDTATVTAINMIAATTGLSAFLLLRSLFISVSIPPFLVHNSVNGILRFKSY